jgi:hypothetical protein
MAKESDYLPDFVFRDFAFPRSHPGIANAVLDDPEHLPIRHLRGSVAELLHSGIKRSAAPITGFARVPMASGAATTVHVQSGPKVSGLGGMGFCNRGACREREVLKACRASLVSQLGGSAVAWIGQREKVITMAKSGTDSIPQTKPSLNPRIG